MEKIKINTEFIKLDQLLKWVGIADMGADAKYMITQGYIKVNDQICLQRGKKIFKGDIVEVQSENIFRFSVE